MAKLSPAKVLFQNTLVRRRPHLACDPVRAELSESEGRRDLPEEGDDVDVLDPSLGVGVVLAPEAHELVEVVGAEDGPVAGQVVKVVHDDGHEEVEDEERAAAGQGGCYSVVS